MRFNGILLISLAGLSMAAPGRELSDLSRRDPQDGGLGGVDELLAKRDNSAAEIPASRLTAKDREGALSARGVSRRDPIIGDVVKFLSVTLAKRDNSAAENPASRLTAKDREGVTSANGLARRDIFEDLLRTLNHALTKRDDSAEEIPTDQLTAKDREGLIALLQSQLDQIEDGSDQEYGSTATPEQREKDKGLLKSTIAKLQSA